MPSTRLHPIPHLRMCEAEPALPKRVYNFHTDICTLSGASTIYTSDVKHSFVLITNRYKKILWLMPQMIFTGNSVRTRQLVE